MLGQAGDGLLQTALATFVLFSPQRESSPTRITLVFALLLLPYSLIGPVAGIVIDKWARHRTLIIANLIRASAMLLIAITVAGHQANTVLTLLVLCSLGVNRFVLATHAASLPHVVKPDLLIAANALFPPLGTASASLAAALGLFLQHIFSATDATNSWLITLAALFVALASMTVSRIRPLGVLGPHGLNVVIRGELRNVVSSIYGAIAHIRSHRHVIVSMSMVTLQRLTFGAMTVHTLLLARNVWHPLNAPSAALTDFGLAAGSAALGVFVAALLSAFVLNRKSALDDPTGAIHGSRFLHMMLWTTLVTLVIATIAVLRGERVITMCAAFALGCAGQLMKIHADSTIQRQIDDVHRGRTFALFDMAINVATVLGISLFALVSPIREHANLGAAFIALFMLLGVKCGWWILQRTPGNSVTVDLPTTAAGE